MLIVDLFAINCYQLQTNWHSCTCRDLNLKISNSYQKFRVSGNINSRHFWCIMICHIIDWLTVLSWTEIKFFKLICTAKRIWDRSIASSIKSKFDDQLFADFRVLYQLQTWNCFCFDLQSWQNNFGFTTWTKHVNQQRIEEISDLFCINSAK